MVKRILILEENLLMLDVMAYILMSNGYEVFALANAAGIFNCLKRNHPDLIIIDTTLTGISGGEICQLIKLNKTTSNVPVIMCTDEAGRDTPDTGLPGAPDDVLEKPFDINSLIKKVAHRLAA